MFMHQLGIGWYVNYAKQQGQRTIYITRWKLWAGDVEIRCPPCGHHIRYVQKREREGKSLVLLSVAWGFVYERNDLTDSSF